MSEAEQHFIEVNEILELEAEGVNLEDHHNGKTWGRQRQAVMASVFIE